MAGQGATGNGKSTPPTAPPGGKADLESRSEKPPALPVNPDGIPAELRERPQWVCWRYDHRRSRGGAHKWTKLPLDAKTLRAASSTDPATWGEFAAAMDACRAGRLDGIGF